MEWVQSVWFLSSFYCEKKEAPCKVASTQPFVSRRLAGVGRREKSIAGLQRRLLAWADTRGKILLRPGVSRACGRERGQDPAHTQTPWLGPHSWGEVGGRGRRHCLWDLQVLPGRAGPSGPVCPRAPWGAASQPPLGVVRGS